MIPEEVLRLVNTQYNVNISAREYRIPLWKMARNTFFAMTPSINRTKKYLIDLMHDPARQNINVFEDTFTFFELIQTFQSNIKSIVHGYRQGTTYNERDATFHALDLLLQTQFVATHPNANKECCITPQELKELMTGGFFTEEIFTTIIINPHPGTTARQIMSDIPPHNTKQEYYTRAYISPIEPIAVILRTDTVDVVNADVDAVPLLTP